MYFVYFLLVEFGCHYQYSRLPGKTRLRTANCYVPSGDVNPLECRDNYSATSNNMKLVQWPLTGGLLDLVQRGGAAAPHRPLVAVPNLTAHPSTAIVPITV